MARTTKTIADKQLKRLLKNLAHNVRGLREKEELTLLSLAAKSHLAISTVLEIEKEKVTQVELGTITSLARGLGIDDPLKLLEGPDAQREKRS